MRARAATTAVLLGAAVAAGCAATDEDARRPRELPTPVVPAFTPGPPRPLAKIPGVTRWAPVRMAVVARRSPSPSATPVGTLETRTPEDTDAIVPVLGRRTDARGRPWVRVAVPAIGSARIGWVERSALGGYTAVRTRLVVDLERLQATLYRSGRRVFRAPVGVGRPGWPTPRGRFLIRNRLTRYRSATYGPIAFGTSARSPRATDWPAGGYVGIHGTNRPDLIPGRVSHGCVRLRNADILALARLMPVGTPVEIR
jgi:hypothetical protein